ncbi:MAG: Fic family protein [Cyanobacteria bacterium]|nr:Fic family protein [Cyanobacteriota bacterium]
MAEAKAIQGSNSIEGIHVTVDDAIAAVQNEEPLDADSEAWLAIKGYQSAMTYVLQLSDDPHFSFSRGLIRSLHFMMLEHELQKHPGKWRPGPVYVRNEQSGETVYEGPDESEVNDLMHELVESLNAKTPAPIMVRAAMAHLNLVMIHPFSDGNGRMGRCVQTLVLAREQILAPAFCSIEEYLGKNQQAYYDVLGEVGAGAWHPERDARPWIRFCLTAHYRQATRLVQWSRIYQRIWDQIETELVSRKLPERFLLALIDAAIGYRVRNPLYRKAAEVSELTASRDLKALVEEGLLIAKGERRGRYYLGSPILKEFYARAYEAPTNADPFKLAESYLPGLAPL